MLDLFSGIGGFSLAASWTGGIETVAFCEIEPYCQKVLHKHWPDVPIYPDIKQLRGEDIGSVDIVCGGFPCQPFSVAGKQKGKRDDRYLWPEMLRVIREIKPTWVLGENVPGILQIAGKTVCEDLEREGYAVTVFNFEAAAVGAPHRRDRVFFVANRQDGNEQEQQKCDNREEHKRRTQVRYGLGAGRGSKDGDSSERVEIGSGVTTEVSEDVADTDEQGLQGRERRELQECASEQFVGKGSTPVANTSCKLREWDRRARDRRSESPNSGWRAVESDVGGVASRLPCWLDGYWRVEPNIPRVATGVKNRVDRLKCLGNAVVPQQVYPILQGIVDIENN